MICANCKRDVPRSKMEKGRLVCKDKKACGAATAAWIEAEKFPQGVAAAREW